MLLFSNTEREFIIFDYHVSFQQFVLRSKKNEAKGLNYNIDLYFLVSGFFALPVSFQGLEVYLDRENTDLSIYKKAKNDVVFKLVSQGKSYYIIGTWFDIYMNKLHPMRRHFIMMPPYAESLGIIGFSFNEDAITWWPGVEGKKPMITYLGRQNSDNDKN